MNSSESVIHKAYSGYLRRAHSNLLTPIPNLMKVGRKRMEHRCTLLEAATMAACTPARRELKFLASYTQICHEEYDAHIHQVSKLPMVTIRYSSM